MKNGGKNKSVAFIFLFSVIYDFYHLTLTMSCQQMEKSVIY